MRIGLGRLGWLIAGSALVAASCANFDGERRAPARLSLGDELYGVMCDRLGASILTEDLEARSYRGVCHANADGVYADTVDVSVLPPAGGAMAVTRTFALSKFDALVRRRSEVVAALNATFPDTELTHPLDSDKVIGGHQALGDFLKSIAPLHETNPADPGGEALFPSVTRSAGRLLAGLAGPDLDNPITAFIDELRASAARDALAGIAGRQGYRPLTHALGAISPALAYPDLRTFIQTLSPQFGRSGALRDSLQDVLAMTEYELQTSELADETLVPYSLDDATTLQPNRARTKLEIGAAALLGSDDAFQTFDADARYLAERDHRGVAIPSGSTPGVPDTLPAPFSDADTDGFADVDGFGRFLGSSGKLAKVALPFKLPTHPAQGTFDEHGRSLDEAGEPQYRYLDTSRTLAAAVIRDLGPLIAPRVGDSESDRGDTVADLLRGAHILYGDAVEHNAPWGGVYEGYDTGESPLVDLVHAAGQLLAHPRSDSWITMIKTLADENEQKFARIIAGVLKLKEISDAIPEARLDPSVTFWDEFAEILVKLAEKPELFKDVLRSIADPNTQDYLGGAFARYNMYRDLMTYDVEDLNGPAVNMTTPAFNQPATPVDRSQPDTGDNRSEWQRFAQIIHDMNGVNACNKQNAKIWIKIELGAIKLNVFYPGGDGFEECSLFVFKDIGLLYLEALLDEQYGRVDDAQGALLIQDNILNIAANLGKILNISMAYLFEESSNIIGFADGPTIDGKAALIATPPAFNRLVFFGAESNKYDEYFPDGAMPDRDPYILKDEKNFLTNRFVSNLLDPVPTSACPTRKVGDLDLQDCSPDVTHETGLLAGEGGRPEDVLRLRGEGVIFTWEMFEFYKGIAPVLKAFSDHGEGQLFVDMVEVLYRHWATDATRAECNSDGTWRKGQPDTNPYFCSGSGISNYEPVLAEALETTDLLASVGEIITVIDEMEFVDERAFNSETEEREPETRKGLDVLHEIVVSLMDRGYAKEAGIKDRFGSSTTTYSDGSVPPDLEEPLQVTTFDLLANSLKAIDAKFVGSDRLTGWRRARSNIVDSLLAVSGEGEDAQFVNPDPSIAPAALPKALPILLDVLREQINANCPDREAGVPCTWASEDLAKKAAETIGDPTFGTVMTLLDKAFSNDKLRTEVGKFLHYLLLRASEDDVRHATLASLADLFQLLGDETRMPALYWAAAYAASPSDSDAPGAVDRLLELIEVVTKEEFVDGERMENPYDPYGVLDGILRNLVMPIDPSDEQSPTPLGVLLDTIAEVNRYDASAGQDVPLDADDYRFVFATVRDFLTSETRGMEQFYEIIHHRNGD